MNPSNFFNNSFYNWDPMANFSTTVTTTTSTMTTTTSTTTMTATTSTSASSSIEELSRVFPSIKIENVELNSSNILNSLTPSSNVALTSNILNSLTPSSNVELNSSNILNSLTPSSNFGLNSSNENNKIKIVVKNEDPIPAPIPRIRYSINEIFNQRRRRVFKNGRFINYSANETLAKSRVKIEEENIIDFNSYSLNEVDTPENRANVQNLVAAVQRCIEIRAQNKFYGRVSNLIISRINLQTFKLFQLSRDVAGLLRESNSAVPYQGEYIFSKCFKLIYATRHEKPTLIDKSYLRTIFQSSNGEVFMVVVEYLSFKYEVVTMKFTLNFVYSCYKHVDFPATRNLPGTKGWFLTR